MSARQCSYPVQAGAARSRTLLWQRLLDGERAHKARAGAGAPCALRLGGAAMEGQGNTQGWVGANAEHRLGCVYVGGLKNGGGLLLQSFHSSKASSTQLSRLALQRHKPAHNCFCVNQRPFHAVVNPQAPSKSAGIWRGRQMHTAGIDPQTEGGAGAGHLRLSLCPGQTRSFWGTRTSCVSTQKPVSLTADDDCRLQDYG